MSVVVGVDLGGTKTAAAVVGPDGAATSPVRRAATPAARGPEAVLDAVADLVRHVLDDAGVSGVIGLRGLGVGTAGIVDVAGGRILSATASMPGWPGTDVARGLTARLGVPVTVQNDVDAHATGEAWVGAAAGASSALVVAVGTGIGGCLVLDGRPWRGAHGAAGEVGHVPAPGAEHLMCPCGRAGHLEAIGAGPGLLRHFRSLGGQAADSHEVVERAALHEVLARRALEDAARAVGRGVAGLVTALDPEVVVLTGGLVDIGEPWWAPMEAALRGELVDVLRDVPVRPAALGATAAIVGAARPVWEGRP